MIYYENSGTNPFFNLALEEVLLDLNETEPILLLWQNEPTIVVGRYQNTAGEINDEFVRTRKVHVVRRMTGGGAVYHDFGNLNFSILQNAPEDRLRIDFSFFTRPVLDVLIAAGVNAEQSGRNDLMVAGRKISGNAQTRNRHRVLHHGTLLFDSQLDDVASALHVSPDKFRSKGVMSVRSRVANIKEFLPADSTLQNVADFKELILMHLTGFGDVTRRTLPPEIVARAQELQKTKYETWSWNYGQSPPGDYHFSRRFPWGKIELFLHLQHGVIADGTVHGDFFTVNNPQLILDQIRGLPPDDLLLDNILNKPEIQALFLLET